MGKHASTERQQIKAGRVAVLFIGAIGAALAILAGKTFNVQLLTGLTFAVAASANFPRCSWALTWRLTTVGALVGILSGLITSIVLIILSPQVWSGPARAASAPAGAAVGADGRSRRRPSPRPLHDVGSARSTGWRPSFTVG